MLSNWLSYVAENERLSELRVSQETLTKTRQKFLTKTLLHNKRSTSYGHEL